MKIAIQGPILILNVLLVGCANPLNQVTADRYSQTCSEAESEGNLELAAEACYRAYMNVGWGNLGAEEKSEKLYNFGRVLRKSGRYKDSEEALTRAIEEEKSISGSDSIKSGRRMAELAATYLELRQYENGVPYLDTVVSATDRYTAAERQFIAALLYFYGNELQDRQRDKANAYHKKMAELGYSGADFE